MKKNTLLLNATLIGMCGFAMTGCGEMTPEEKAEEAAEERFSQNKNMLYASLIANDKDGIKNNAFHDTYDERNFVLFLMLEGKIGSKAFTNYVKSVKTKDDLEEMTNKLLRIKENHEKRRDLKDVIKENIDKAIMIVYDEMKIKIPSSKGKVSVIHPDPRVAKGLENFLNNNRAMV